MPAGEFKAKCLEAMDEVASTGEPIIVTKRGRPVAQIVPITRRPKSLRAFLRGSITALGVPFLYLEYGLLSPLRLESRKTYSEACDRATALIPLSFAYAGGAFLGTPFILPSLFFADDPDYCWAD